MTTKRKQEIAAIVLAHLVPGAEAVEPIRGLQKKLRRLCQSSSETDLSEKLIGIAVPAVDGCYKAGLLTVEEAQDFVCEVIGELVGVDLAAQYRPIAVK